MRAYLTFIIFTLCIAAAQAQFTIPKNVSYQALDSLIDEYFNVNIDYPIATELLEFAVAKAKADSSENSHSYIKYLDNLAFLYVELQQYTLADSLAAKVVALADKNKLTLLKAESLNTRGVVASQLKDWPKAEKFYLQAKTAAETAQHPALIIDIVGNLALHYKNIGDITQAKMMFEESIQRQLARGKKTLRYCILLSNIITLHTKTERDTTIEAMITELLQLYEDSPSYEVFYADALSNAATYYQKTKNYTAAKKCLAKALKIDPKNKNISLSQKLNINLNLAEIYKNWGNYTVAKMLYIQSLNTAIITRKNNPQNTIPNIFDWHIGLAEIYFKENDYANKRQQISLALQDASAIANISGQPSPAWADSLTKHNYPTYLHLHHTTIVLNVAFDVATTNAEKIIIADVAIILFKKISDLRFHEKDKLQSLSQNYTWLNHIFEIITPEQDLEKAFALAENNKAVLLSQANNASIAYQFGGLPQDLANKERELNELYNSTEANLYEAIDKNTQDNLRKKLNTIGIDIRQLKTIIESQYPQYAALKYQQQPLKITEIQTQLPNNTALIEYVVLDKATFVFYIDKQQAVLKKIDISRPALEYKIKNLHNALSNYNYIVEQPNQAYTEYTENAANMYALLLAPVLQNNNKQKINTLIIIPDRHLAHLPFEVFLSSQAPKEKNDYKNLAYLLKDYSISYSYSAQLWKNTTTQPIRNNNSQLLAMAADYPNKKDSTVAKTVSNNNIALHSPKLAQLRNILSPLPAAKEEIKALSKTYKGHFALGDEASELQFKQQSENYAVIHLAMHGLLDAQNPMLSSLAFTEDGSTVENNFLQVFEISKLKLNADLVVLSACETGYGKFEAGNSVASLARAFMYAGVNSLVVSLWAINDASTAVLMHFFYKNLDKGLDKAYALRQAKLQYLSKADGIAAHPALWSPFIQIGNRQPVTLQKKTTTTQYLLYTLAPISSFGLLFFYLRRRKSSV
jgi:CHAT domain-containing protein